MESDIRFSALQRAEIAEIRFAPHRTLRVRVVSVLFNEPKLLKSTNGNGRDRSDQCFSALQRAEIAEIPGQPARRFRCACFSALQRAEIAEIMPYHADCLQRRVFQCSSTSRNC